MEEWKIIKEFPTYSVSNCGKVKNNLTYIYDYKITSLDNPSKYFKLGINCLREEEDEV